MKGKPLRQQSLYVTIAASVLLKPVSGVASFITTDEQLQLNRGCFFSSAGFVS